MPALPTLRRGLTLTLTTALVAACAARKAPEEPEDAPPPNPVMQAVFDPAAHGPGDPPPSLPAAPLVVVSNGPQGRTEGGGDIHVRFSQPVVALGLDEAAEGLLVVDPPLAGRARWRSPELLIFAADAAMQPATTYSVRLAAPIVASDGRRYEGPLSWTFETPRPQVTSSVVLNLAASDNERVHHRRAAVYLLFDQPTTRAEVVAHVRAFARPLAAAELDDGDAVSDDEGAAAGRRAAVPVRVEAVTRALFKRHHLDDQLGEPGEGEAYLITPSGLWPGASRVSVEVTPGLRGKLGELRSETPYSETFDTYGPQAIVAQSCAADERCAMAPLTYTLRNPMRARELKKISVSPRPKSLDIALGDDWDEEGGREIVISGIFLPGTTYTVTIGGQLRDVFGQTLGATFSQRATIDREPTIGLSDSSAILRASEPRTFGVTTRHVDTIEVRATKLPDRALAAMLARNNFTGVSDIPPATSRTIDVHPKGPTDWAELAIDLADLVGDFRGAVLVEVRATKAVAAAADHPLPEAVRGVFRVTDMGAIANLSGPRSSLQVVDLLRGGAIAGATIEHLVGDVLTPLGTTDARGIAALPGTAAWPCGAPAKASAKKSSDKKSSDKKSSDKKSSDKKSSDKKSSAAKAKSTTATRKKPAPKKIADQPAAPSRCADDLGAQEGVLVIRDPRTQDTAYLPVRPANDLWGQTLGEVLRSGESLIQRVITERGAYRPGEEIHVMGWTAVATPFTPSGLRRLSPRTAVTVVAENPRGEVIASAEVHTTREGKYSATLTLPDHAPLGRYAIRAKIADQSASAALKVEDFRTPEFQVEARVERGDVIIDEPQRVLVNASYYFGGPVVIEEVRYSPECSDTRYRPPGLDPHWAVGARLNDRNNYGNGRVSLGLARPNAQEPARDGAIDFPVLVHAPRPGLAARCLVSVEIRDASLQAIGAETTYLAHSAPFYLALGLPERTPKAGDRHDIAVRAVHFDGHRVGARAVEIKVERTHDEPVYREENGRKVLYGTKPRTRAVKSCTLDLRDAGDDARCALPTLAEGTYSITASAADGERKTLSEASFWVRPKPKDDVAWTYTPPARLEIETSTQQVRPGDKVAIRVRAPWDQAPALLLIERSGIREARPLFLTKEGAELTLTADDTWTPNIHLEAVAVRPGSHSAFPTIQRARATIKQGQDHRRLQVRVDTALEIGPAEKTDVHLELRDADGAPAAGRVALWVVDEAVLALTSYEVPELLSAFNASAGADTSHADDFARLRFPFVPQTEDPWLLEGGGYGSGYGSGMGAGHGSRAPSIRAGHAQPPARSLFKTTPVFLADLAIDETGKRTVEIEAPENLTTFRVFAVASGRLVDGESPGRLGLGDARIRVSKPLVLRSALPRGLRPGDRAEIAAILQNRSGKPGTVEVTAKVIGEHPGVRILGPTTAKAPLSGDGQVRLPFSITADRPGAPEIELQAALVDGSGAAILHDGMRVPVPVEAERTQIERVAIYGTVADAQPIGVPVRLPTAVLPGLGGITVSTTSTLLGGLEDAIHELITYPYGCVEQTASRLLPLIAIRDLQSEFPLEVDVAEQMAAGVERILSMQTSDGGFAYWPGGTISSPYASSYATWVLHRAQKAGHPIPDAALQRALDYVGVQAAPGDRPGEFDDLREIRRAIAVHTLADAGRPVKAAVDHLFERRQRLPIFARAFLLMAMKADASDDPRIAGLTDELLGNLSETPASAHVHEAIAFDFSSAFHSDGRSDAIVLMALLRVRPDHPLIAKLVRGVMDRRTGGAWRNTQENAYSLLALADYVEIYEKEVPDLLARAWVGRLQILDAAFRGRETATRSRTIAMGPLLASLSADGGPAPELVPVILQRQGTGRLYYRIGAEWAPAGVDLPARDQGLRITRDLRVRDGALSPGVAITPGDTVAVDIHVHADTRTPFVAIEVPIPSGLEAIQRELGKGQRAMTIGGGRGSWVSFEEQRRDRVVLFADDLSPGDHVHTAFLRATTPGEYRVPPAVAEAMYAPEVYGRSTATAVKIASP